MSVVFLSITSSSMTTKQSVKTLLLSHKTRGLVQGFWKNRKTLKFKVDLTLSLKQIKKWGPPSLPPSKSGRRLGLAPAISASVYLRLATNIVMANKKWKFNSHWRLDILFNLELYSATFPVESENTLHSTGPLAAITQSKTHHLKPASSIACAVAPPANWCLKKPAFSLLVL